MTLAKENLRRQLQEAALALFLEHGFERTTAADIAEKVGVTERTFFRYFPDKREVLFDEAALNEGLNAAVEAAPPGLPPMEVLRFAFHALEPLFDANRPLTGPGRALIAHTPALRERQLAKAASTTAVLAAALDRRGVAPDIAGLAAASGIVVFIQAFEAWQLDPALSLHGHLERAFQAWRQLAESGEKGAV